MRSRAAKPERAGYPEYFGLSYEAASREAERLFREATERGDWFSYPERLIQLRDAMIRHLIMGSASA